MALPWVRLDTALWHHPKMLALREQKKKSAALAYYNGLSYSGAHELDGFIPSAALPLIDASKQDAAALVAVGFWRARPGGWEINGWADYQISGQESRDRRKKMQAASAKGNCRKYHPEGCRCWEEGAA